MWILLLLLSIGPYVTFVAYAQPTHGTDVTLDFSWQNHYAETAFNKPVYRNVHGQTYSISTLRYYIHNVALRRSDGVEHIQKTPVLIDHGDDASTTVTLNNVPSGIYTSLSFIVGVDSSDNAGGPQEGALDPLNGMYWTWATGFIFFKLEGTSPASTQPKHIIEFHLGGFQAPYNNIQRIELPLRREMTTGYGNTSLGIVFDAGAFIDADGGIDFVTTSSITDVQSAAPYMRRLQGAFHVR